GPYSRDKPSEVAKAKLGTLSTGWDEDFHHGMKTIHAYSPVRSDIFTRVPVSGAIKGVSGEKWVPSKWHMFIEVSTDEAFASVHEIRNMLVAVAVLILLTVFILSVVIANRISEPVERLTDGVENLIGSAEKLGRFKMWREVKVESSDEIGTLTAAFNKMARELSDTTVSRDLLVSEMEVRLAADEALKESESGLADAEKIAHLGHWKLNPRTNEVTGSTELYRIFGLSTDVSIFDAFIDMVHPEDKERVEATINKGRVGEPWNIEQRLLFSDGTVKTIQSIGKPFKDSVGKVVMIVGTIQDITARKKAEEQFSELSLRNEAVISSIPDIVMEVDNKKIYTWANKVGLKFFGHDVIGKEASEYFVGEQDTYDVVKPMFDGSEDVIYVESWQRRYDGEKRLLAWWSHVLKDPHGNVTGALSTARDITEKNLAEQQVINALEEKEILLKEVHHRVKNNLQVISSMLNLQSSYIKDVETQTVLSDSQNRIKSMALIHEMLYKSHNFSRIDISTYMHELMAILFSTYNLGGGTIDLNEKIQVIAVDIDTAIPIGLITNELVSNSLKYAFPDGRDGTVSIEFITEPDGTRTLIVSDDGVGMPKEFALDNINSLGLNLVKMLTKQLGATLEVNADEGTSEGTSFKIMLPKRDYV
ncbi:MAG: histidine kinase dimerization/phosphoacceptor domain -containing protein, partial [Thermodesulfobacteriota bacterium]